MVKKIPLSAIVVVVAVAIVSCFVSATDGGDFDVYLDAAAKLKQGDNIYQPPFVKGLQYYYSVFFALVLAPFSSLVFIAEVIWLLLSYFLLYRTWKLASGYFDLSALSTKKYRYWVGLTVLLALQFIMYNVAMIQVTIFLLWAIFESLNLIENKKPILAGLLLALAINIKIMPLLMLPYLFYKGRFKTLAAVVFFFVALLYIPAVFIGVDYNNFLLAEWWAIINPSNKEHVFETGIGMHSLTAMLPVYLTPTVGEMPYARNVFNLTIQQAELVLNITRLFLLGLSLLFFKSLPFKKEAYRLKEYWQASYFIMLIPLLLPHQQKYAFLFVLPMVMYLLYYFIVTYNGKRPKLYYAFVLLFIISMLFYSPLYGADVIGKFLFEYTQHYRILTFATLSVIPIALYFNPDKLQKIATVNKAG